MAVGVSDADQLGVDRMTVIAIHVNLLEHREANAVRGRAELLDLLGRTRLLTHELIAGKTHHAETSVGVLAVQRFESLVLRRQTTLGRDVDDEHGAIAVGRQRRWLTGEGSNGYVVDSHGVTIPVPVAQRCRRR